MNWNPITIESKLTKKLTEISDVLCENFEKVDDIGLLSGKSGIALYFFYYAKLVKQQKFIKLGTNIFTEILNKINNGYNYHTFCSGIGGFAWTLEHLAQNDFINYNEIEFLDELDSYLYNKMLNDIKNAKYDFLHAAIGIAIYFLSRKLNNNIYKKLEVLINQLEVVSHLKSAKLL